jgi:hypothetical protein
VGRGEKSVNGNVPRPWRVKNLTERKIALYAMLAASDRIVFRPPLNMEDAKPCSPLHTMQPIVPPKTSKTDGEANKNNPRVARRHRNMG